MQGFPGLTCRRTRGPLTWTSRTSNFGNYALSCLGVGGGNWVAEGGYAASNPRSRVIYNDTTDPTDAWTLNVIEASSNSHADRGIDFDGTTWAMSGSDSAVGNGILYTTDVTGAWTLLVLPFTPSGIKYANSLWVCGDSGNGKIYTSVAPTTTWTARTSNLTGRVADIDYDGSSYWATVGYTGEIGYTTDPTGTMSLHGSPPFSSTPACGIAYGNGYWVAVGNSGKLATCYGNPNGTWTLHGDSSFSSAQIAGIGYGDGFWVAVGAAGKIATCGSNPTGKWTQRTSPFDSGHSLAFVKYNNGYWVVAGTDIDGTTYTGVVATAVNGL